jgi:death-on-curing protein
LSGPSFISPDALLALHDDLLREFGGPEGVNLPLVESVAAYPVNKFAYDEQHDIPTLAGHLSFAAASFHAFTDGNKRVALASLALFLAQNGFELAADEDDAEDTIRAAADHAIAEEDFVAWVCGNSVRLYE